MKLSQTRVLSRSMWGFEKGATILHQFTSDVDLKIDPDYKAAKAGDLMAALGLVKRLLRAEFLDEVKIKFSDADFLMPIYAEEMQGDNAIPIALAASLSYGLNLDFSAECIQTNRAYHTGADPMERLVSRATFGGSISAGKKYVLVDDVSTMGSTLADCASYVANHGGIVVGAILLANCSRSRELKAKAQHLKIIEERYYETVKQLFSIAPSALTYDEALYVVGFRTSDELRSRAIAAENERKNRIASKSVPKP
jgi:hypothetical protein